MADGEQKAFSRIAGYDFGIQNNPDGPAPASSFASDTTGAWSDIGTSSESEFDRAIQVQGPHVLDGFYARAAGPVKTPTHPRKVGSTTASAQVAASHVLQRHIQRIIGTIPPFPDTGPTDNILRALIREWLRPQHGIGFSDQSNDDALNIKDPKIVLDQLTHLCSERTPKPSVPNQSVAERTELERTLRTVLFIRIARLLRAALAQPEFARLRYQMSQQWGADYVTSTFWTYTSLHLSMSMSTITEQIVGSTAVGRGPSGRAMATGLTQTPEQIVDRNTSPAAAAAAQGPRIATINSVDGNQYQLQIAGQLAGKELDPVQRMLMIFLAESIKSRSPVAVELLRAAAESGLEMRIRDRNSTSAKPVVFFDLQLEYRKLMDAEQGADADVETC